MMYLPANLKKYRLQKELTQEDVADYLGITAQSVSKWERGESYPDITLLPALANIFETSVNLLLGMDTIRAEETRLNIHKKAIAYQRSGDLDLAEKTYREALLIYPNKPGMILGLAGEYAFGGAWKQAQILESEGVEVIEGKVNLEKYRIKL